LISLSDIVSIVPLISLIDIVSIVPLISLSDIVSIFPLISLSDIVSILHTWLSLVMASRPIRLAVILVIMSVSILKHAVILYLSREKWIQYFSHYREFIMNNIYYLLSWVYVYMYYISSVVMATCVCTEFYMCIRHKVLTNIS
jgi:hypothetical protein